jgi:hypothetical protein
MTAKPALPEELTGLARSLHCDLLALFRLRSEKKLYRFNASALGSMGVGDMHYFFLRSTKHARQGGKAGSQNE